MNVVQPNDKRPIGQLSIDAKTLMDRLRLAAVGTTVRYSELNELIGRDVQGTARSCLQTARRRLLREGIDFGVLLNEGLKRLNTFEQVQTGYAANRHTVRHNRRARRRIMAAKYEELSEKDKNTRNAFLLSMRMAELVATEKTIKRLEKAADEVKKPLSLAATLEMFSKKVPKT